MEQVQKQNLIELAKTLVTPERYGSVALAEVIDFPIKPAPPPSAA